MASSSLSPSVKVDIHNKKWMKPSTPTPPFLHKFITAASCNMNKVSIQSQKWIKPATPTPPHLHKLNLSFIDQLQPPMFVQLILHFDIIKDDKTEKQRIAHLEESLSKILTLYYPYAGRYDNVDESSVSCEDQGMKFVVATVDCKLAELDDCELYDEETLVSGLDKVVLSSDVASAPVVSVQVNVFTCGGIAIGVSFLHKVSDIFTFSSFMDAWATTCRLGTLDDQIVPPSFTISSLLPPNHLLIKSPNSSKLPPPPQPELSNMHPQPRFVTKRFIFTKESILKLKASTAESNTTNYTRVQLLTALITRSLVKIENAKGAEARPFVIFHTINMRWRVTMPIEENLCGDLYTLSTVRGLEKESWEVGELAELIRNSINDVVSDIENVKDWGEVSNMVEKKYMEFYEEEGKGKDEVNMMTFSSWCRFPLNEIDFGWGPPSRISTLPSSFAITHLIDHKSDGGIEAWVCLKEDEMACFQNKPDILEYALSKPIVAKAIT